MIQGRSTLALINFKLHIADTKNSVYDTVGKTAKQIYIDN